MPSCHPLHARPPSPPVTSLLAALPPDLSAPVHVMGVRRVPRLLQLRANVILLFRPHHTPHPREAVLTLPLTSDLRLRHLSEHHIRLNRTTFHFAHIPHASAFYFLVQRILVRLSAPPPQYVLHTVLAPHSRARLAIATRQADPRLLVVQSIVKPAALPNVVAARQAHTRARIAQTPFAVRLVDAMETSRHFHFVCELAALGDLHSFLDAIPNRRLPERVVRAIAAELVLAIRDLHDCGVRHRHIQPTNILLTAAGHVCLSNFSRAATSVEPFGKGMITDGGCAGCGESSPSGMDDQVDVDSRTGSSWSTASKGSLTISEDTILRPALSAGVRGDAAEETEDVHALGEVLFEMLTGKPPFPHRREMSRMGRNLSRMGEDEGKPVVMPDDVSVEARDLLSRMLDGEESRRIGVQGLMAHKWLADVDWEDIRRAAIDEERHVEVMLVVKEFGIKEIFNRDRTDSFSEGGKQFAAVAGELYEHECMGAERRRRKWRDGQHLLGFDYL